MRQSVHIIRAGINCVLVRGESGSVLVDTGHRSARPRLMNGLASAGLRPDEALTVILTHGDTDHTGSAHYLKETFGATLAAHRAEAGVLDRGDMTRSRKERPDRMPWIFRALLPISFLFWRSDPVTLDLTLEDGQSLASFGVDGTILHLPGHSRGSIGILLPTGELVCGDLLWNMRRPRMHPLIDDMEPARASIARIRELPVTTLVPAHGQPFSTEELTAI